MSEHCTSSIHNTTNNSKCPWHAKKKSINKIYFSIDNIYIFVTCVVINLLYMNQTIHTVDISDWTKIGVLLLYKHTYVISAVGSTVVQLL